MQLYIKIARQKGGGGGGGFLLHKRGKKAKAATSFSGKQQLHLSSV